MDKTMVELFSGSKIMANTFKDRGYKVFTIDGNKDMEPDLTVDILDFEIDMLPKEFQNPDVVWASPPCTKYSVASVFHYWKNGKPKTWKTYVALAVSMKTVEIIRELKPIYWFIENPVGMLRKQHFMNELPKVTVTYCQYGENRRKPTDIWTNAAQWIPKKMCRNGDQCHEASPRSSYGGGTQALKTNYERSKLPGPLCQEIADVCEGDIKQKQMVLKS